MKVRFLHPAIGEFAVHLRPGGATVIGRAGAQADIELTWDRRISRRHAKLFCLDGDLWFEDLGSRNGSWRGSERITTPLRLTPGSSVLMGETALVVPETETEDEARDVEQTYEAPVPEGLEQRIAAAVTHPQLHLGELVRIEEGSTMDLRSPLEESSEDIPAADPAAPRFVAANRVEIDADREGLARLWRDELSKGGVYVPTSEAPAAGARVEVYLMTGAGRIDFNAQVVSVVTPEQASAFGMPPGAGLQITDLSGPKKAALEDYVEGRSVTVGVASAPGRDEAPPVEAALEQARRLLAKADEEALYAAVGLSPETPTAKVRTELEALADRFKSSMPHAKPPQAARLQAALTVLERLGRVLVNPEARLEYDFRAGHVRAPTRIVAAAERQGPDLATLRRVWNRVHPDKVDEAARLTRKAFAARQEHDLDVAVRYGRRALEMNPFFEELRKTVDAWQRNLSDAKARPQRRPKGASSAR